jgi:ParB family transcriptional regulator, chromosome partitioning protein
MTDLIALNKLVASTDNARKTGIADGLEELAASIAAHGLLQSLVVRKTSRGKFAVIAGQRRRMALSMLAEQGSIPADMPIACKVLSKDSDAAEISLAENVVRVPMHPADQFEAFRALIDNGAGIADVAARFGVLESFVARRMKLGRVSPALLAVYREGGMSLEQLQAFTVSDDHAAQERVWQEGAHHPGGIRSALTEGEIPSTDKRVRFVGLEAYEGAGGEVRRDLFDTGNSGYILDAELLQKLTQDKLAQEVAAVTAEGWKWVELRESFDWQERSEFNQHRELAPLPADEQEVYDALTAELDELENRMNDEEADDDEATSDRIREIAESIDRMDDRPAFYPPEIVAESGAILFLDYDGDLVIERGLTAKTAAPRPGAAAQGKPAGDPSGVSASLAEYLTAQKTAAIRAELAQSPSVALAAVAHALALSVFYRGSGTCLEISTRLNSLQSVIRNADDSKALATLDVERDRWQDRLPGEHADLWDWCLGQTQDTLLDLMAICAACTVDAVQTKHEVKCLRHADDLAEALKLDMGQWFTPTASNFFAKISKQAILDSIAEARGTPCAPSWQKLKKPELAMLAEHHTAGTGWLPKPVRLPPQTGAVVSVSKAA